MKKLFNNTLFTLIDYVVLIGLNLAATPLLIDHFGVDGYGAFIFLNMFSIFGALAVLDLGMEGALMNYIARFEAAGEHGKMHNALSVSLIYYALIGIVAGIGLYFCGDLLTERLLDSESTISPDVVRTAVLIVSVNLVFQFLAVPLTAALQGMRRYVATKSISSAANVGRYILLVIVAVYTHRIDYGYLIVLLVTLLRLGTLGFMLFGRTPSFRRWRMDPDMAMFKTLFSYSSILFVTRLIGLLHNNAPKMFIWYYMSVATMAVYDIVARPAMLLRAIMGVMVSALIPEAAGMHEKGDMEGLRKLYVNLVRYSYLILLPILAILFAYIDQLIGLWVGERFEPQAYLSLILLAGFLIMPISSIANTMVVGLQKVRETIWIPAVGVALNIVVSVILVNRIGLAGLLFGTVTTHIFAFVPYLLFMKRFLDFRLSDLSAAVRSGFLLAAASFLLNWVCAQFVSLDVPWLAAIGSGSLIASFVITARYILKDAEKEFLRDRLAVIRSKFSPDAFRS